MWSPYCTRPRRGNGLRLCCRREPTLRTHPVMTRGEAALVYYECRVCGRAGALTPVTGDPDADEVSARVEWQMLPG